MARFISLKIRISLFLMATVFFLMISFLSFLYFSGRKYLVNSGHRDAADYAAFFKDAVKAEVRNSFLELNSLRNQLEPFPVNPGQEVRLAHPWGQFLKQFLTGYSQKYRFLTLQKRGWHRTFSVVPVKIFGGETRIRFDWLEKSPVPPKFGNVSGTALQGKKQWEKKVQAQNRLLYIRASSENRGLSLIAAVSSDVLLEKIFQSLHFPPNLSAFVTGAGGRVLYSPQESDMNQLLFQSNPRLAALLNRKMPSGKERFEQLGARIYCAESLKIPPYKIFVAKDLSDGFRALNRTLMRMLLFSGAVLLFVLGVVWLLTERMTYALREISTVAGRVARGDFSHKIAIQRQDELGKLIDTFNNMMDRTQASHFSLQQANRALSEKVAELTRTRAELSEKQRLAIIGETVSKISHEIQNKIGGVSIWLQNLEIELRENATAQTYIAEMKTALRSFLEMLAHFKRFYREPQLAPKTVSVSSVLDAVLEQLSDKIREKELKIRRSGTKNLPEISADPQQLEEAIFNILINAIYYSPPQGTLTVSAAVLPETLRISIADEGPGVPEKHALNLFRPFFTTKDSGSGLGLAIADSIVRAHGGSISFENLPRRGVQFTLVLPRGTTGEKQRPRAKAKSDPNFRNSERRNLDLPKSEL